MAEDAADQNEIRRHHTFVTGRQCGIPNDKVQLIPDTRNIRGVLTAFNQGAFLVNEISNNVLFAWMINERGEQIASIPAAHAHNADLPGRTGVQAIFNLAANRSQPGLETSIGFVPFVPGDPVSGHKIVTTGEQYEG